MNDLPTDSGNNGTSDEKPPLLATLEAMQRLKAKNDSLDKRVKNLEDAFEMAFKNGATSLQEFLVKLDEKDESLNEEDGNPVEIEGETVKSNEGETEEKDDEGSSD